MAPSTFVRGSPIQLLILYHLNLSLSALIIWYSKDGLLTHSKQVEGFSNQQTRAY